MDLGLIFTYHVYSRPMRDFENSPRHGFEPITMCSYGIDEVNAKCNTRDG